MRVRGLDDVKAIPILDVAEALGLRIKSTSARCPFVGHDDRNPSFSVYLGENRCWCHRCAKGGSPIDLVAYTKDIPIGDAIAWLRDRFGIDGQTHRGSPQLRRVTTLGQASKTRTTTCTRREAYAALMELCPLNAAAAEYLAGRGLTPNTIQHFKLGAFTDNGATTRALTARFGRSPLIEAGLISETGASLCFIAPAVLFPFYVGGELNYVQARALPGNPAAKWLGLRGVPKPVFNFDVISKARSVYICEGATDVLSAHQMGLAAIGVLGGTTALPNDVLESLRRKDVYLVPDRDAVGQMMAQRLKVQLQRVGISAITKRLDVGGDVNERLIMRGSR